MYKSQIKLQSMERIRKAIVELKKQNEKITEANIKKVSGLSRSTSQRRWKKN